MDAYRVIRHLGDEDEGARWACGTRRQRGPVEIASGSAPAVLRLARTWLPASFGGEILFLSWLARLVGLPNGHVAADGSPGQTHDGWVVRDFKLEPTTREVQSRKAVPQAVYWFEIIILAIEDRLYGTADRQDEREFYFFTILRTEPG